MKQEYEIKRMQYNLLANEIKTMEEKHKKINEEDNDYEKKIKEKKDKEKELKQELEKIFDDNKIEISKEMLLDNKLIEEEFDYYKKDIEKEENKNIKLRKTKEEIKNEINKIKEKIEKRKENNIITDIVYNDLEKCLKIYEENILDNYDKIEEKKVLSTTELKQIKVNLKKKTTLFKGLIIPLTILDIILLIYSIIVHGECILVKSETISGILCSFTILSLFFTRIITPILLVYYIVMIIKKLKKKAKK